MSTRNTWVLAALASVLLAVVGWFLLIGPERAAAADLRAQTDGVEAQNASLETELAQLRQQAADLTETRAELADLRRRLPTEPALPTMIRQLEDAAEASGVTLVAVKPSDPAPLATGLDPAEAGPVAPDLLAVPLTLEITGGYFQTTQFLSELEGMPRSLLIRDIALSVDQSSGGDVIETTLQASVFLQGEVAVGTAPADGTTTAPTDADGATDGEGAEGAEDAPTSGTEVEVSTSTSADEAPTTGPGVDDAPPAS